MGPMYGLAKFPFKVWIVYKGQYMFCLKMVISKKREFTKSSRNITQRFLDIYPGLSRTWFSHKIFILNPEIHPPPSRFRVKHR